MRRIGLTFTVVLSLCAAATGPARAADPPLQPLTRATLPKDGSIALRAQGPGVELRLAWPGAPRRIQARLLGPRGQRGARVTLEGNPSTAVLPRPAGGAADRNLRLELRIRPARGAEVRYVAVASQFLSAPRVLLLGDPTVQAGSHYSPRIVVRTPTGVLAGAEVRVTLQELGKTGGKKGGKTGPGKTLATASSLSGPNGAPSLVLAVPATTRGRCRLLVQVTSELGLAEASFDLTVQRSARVLLSTDKPLYQPGQRMHLRVLARQKGDGHAAGKTRAKLVISDAKGNKVFQKRGRTGPEGVFSTTFEIASMVNTGRWRIEATVGGSTVTRTVEVKPYVLPKFKVTLKTDRTSYRPGELVKGTVSARYFFGKALADAKVVLRARSFDVRAVEIARVELVLDHTGSGRFEVKLPTVLHGSAMAGGAATVKLEATVTDTAGQTYQAATAVPVWKAGLKITVLPEAGRVVGRVENQVYVLVTRPDGAPAKRAAVSVQYGGRTVSLTTDDFGVAVYTGVPDPARPAFRVTAKAPDGATATHVATLAVGSRSPTSVLLRPDNPAPRAGHEVGFEVLVAGTVPHVFLDLVRDGQTLLTLSAPVREGHARFTAMLPQEAAGTLLVHAYAIGDDMEIHADTRPMVVRMASDLKIEVHADREVYRPGQDVSLRLKVTDGQGHGVLAALGLWVVDEAVFALSENRPGMEKVFFLLEQEIMRPKVEIHGFDPAETLTDTGDEDAPEARRRRAARVVAAAAMPAFHHLAKVDSEATARVQSTTLWRAVLTEQVQPYQKAIEAWMAKERRWITGDALYGVLERRGLIPGETRDPFGVPYRLTVPRTQGWAGNAELWSAGPDARMGTADDVRVSLGVMPAWQRVQQKMWKDQRRDWQRKNRGRLGVKGGRIGWFDGAARGAGGRMPMGRMAPKPGDRAAPPAPDMDVLRDGERPVRTRTVVSQTEKKKREEGPGGDAGGEAPRVRSYFPETLYVNPLVLTDAGGEARVGFPAADSITTWRLSAMASTRSGLLGSKDHGLRVFQDFFVDVDMPVSLTRGDEVTVPVAVYNYLDRPQTVTLDLEPEGGLTVQGTTRVTLELGPGQVKGHPMTLVASQVGVARITVTARGTRLSDAVRREIPVEPDGFPVHSARSGALAGRLKLDVEVPEGAIPRASTLQVKLYPGMFSQVVDGLDSMLRMPSGCFEQTSSSTYPNALILAYLRGTKKSRPELEAKALRFLQAGWQRLVTYEVQGGGFSWFGQPPANKILTAYGLMEFHDMMKVYEIDAAVIKRTRRWLEGQQAADGSFAPDAQFLHNESWGDIQKSSVLVTAYIAWSLAYTRPHRESIEPRLRKALDWLARRAGQAEDTYVLSYLANAFAEAVAGRSDAGADRATLANLMGRLAALAKREGKTLHFETTVRTAMHGSGQAAAIEVTALALRAFMRAGKNMEMVGPGLSWLVGTKSSWGNWYSTQATIQVLQAMIASLSAAQETKPGSVEVVLNGEPITTVRYTREDFDVVRFVDASRKLRPGLNTVELIPSEGLEAMYAVTSTTYLPWKGDRRPAARAFDVRVDYDRTKLAKDDVVGVTVTVTSNLKTKAQMGIVDVAIPPGFVLDSEKLEAAVKKESLQRFSQAGRQLILYVPSFDPGKPWSVSYELRARFPVRVSTGPARAYEYYNPDHSGTSVPGSMTVR